MSSNKEIMAKGMRYLVGALPLIFLGPILLSIGYRAMNDNIYLWFILGSIVSLIAIILGVLGVKTILKGLFND